MQIDRLKNGCLTKRSTRFVLVDADVISRNKNDRNQRMFRWGELTPPKHSVCVRLHTQIERDHVCLHTRQWRDSSAGHCPDMRVKTMKGNAHILYDKSFL